MASALVNKPGVAPEPFSPFAWLAPRLSFGRDDDKAKVPLGSSPAKVLALRTETAVTRPPVADGEDCLESDESIEKDVVFDFEFRLDDPVAMLPADELFSDGKLMPLQLSAIRSQVNSAPPALVPHPQGAVPPGLVRFSKQVRAAEVSRPCLDQYVFSPKAPRCSSRWKELLGLKRAAAAAAAAAKPDPPQKPSSTSSPSKSTNPRGLKHFLHRNTKSACNESSSLNLPLLRDSDSDSVSLSSSRLSLSSSSSSGPDHDDLPRLSLDSDKPRIPPRLRVSGRSGLDPSRLLADNPPVRPGRTAVRRAPDVSISPRGASVDSPRMNSYGKVVFQSLERSSSSPSTFNGGPRAKHRVGMERSYSANVRITPVLNVPVCSLRGSSKSGSVFGFGQLFSPQKKETAVASRTGGATTNRSASGGGGGRGEKGASGN